MGAIATPRERLCALYYLFINYLCISSLSEIDHENTNISRTDPTDPTRLTEGHRSKIHQFLHTFGPQATYF